MPIDASSGDRAPGGCKVAARLPPLPAPATVAAGLSSPAAASGLCTVQSCSLDLSNGCDPVSGPGSMVTAAVLHRSRLGSPEHLLLSPLTHSE